MDKIDFVPLEEDFKEPDYAVELALRSGRLSEDVSDENLRREVTRLTKEVAQADKDYDMAVDAYVKAKRHFETTDPNWVEHDKLAHQLASIIDDIDRIRRKYKTNIEYDPEDGTIESYDIDEKKLAANAEDMQKIEDLIQTHNEVHEKLSKLAGKLVHPDDVPAIKLLLQKAKNLEETFKALSLELANKEKQALKNHEEAGNSPLIQAVIQRVKDYVASAENKKGQVVIALNNITPAIIKDRGIRYYGTKIEITGTPSDDELMRDTLWNISERHYHDIASIDKSDIEAKDVAYFGDIIQEELGLYNTGEIESNMKGYTAPFDAESFLEDCPDSAIVYLDFDKATKGYAEFDRYGDLDIEEDFEFAFTYFISEITANEVEIDL